MMSNYSVLIPLVLAAGMLTACAEEKAAPAKKDDLSKATAIFDSPAMTPSPAPMLNPTQVVANVEGKAITGAEVEKEVAGMQANASRRMPPEQIAMMKPRMTEQAVQNMVTKQLLLNAVAAKKITVDADELKKATDDVTSKVPPGQTLDDALKQAGVTKEQFTREMTDGLSIQKLLKDTLDKAAVSDADVKEFYEKNPEQFKQPENASARHILIGFGEGAADDAKKAEALKKANAVRERLLKGEDFAKVCAETSDDPGSKANGGLYEKFPKGQMVPAFETACFTQKIGEVGPPVETQFGYHVIKVEGREEGGVMKLDDVKERLKSFLDGKKKSDAVKDYIAALRKTAKVDYAKGFEPAPEPVVPSVK